MGAAEIQKSREDVNLANHTERILWLGNPRPVWACGTPVDAYTRTMLLQQSRAAPAEGGNNADA